MAAGVGSRFGGTKQLAEIGPSGEALLDYTIVDARRAGFEQVVLIVRDAIRDEMADHLRRFHPDAADFALVRQDRDPSAPARAKPWGTGHAILTVRDHVPGPFVVVNADDHYGREAFVTLAAALSASSAEAGGTRPDLQLEAYELGRTLSPRGSVSRGVCDVADDGTLIGITERLTIERGRDGVIRAEAQAGDAAAGDTIELADDTPVSMNLWGLHPFVFDHLATGFERFVSVHRGDERAEFLLPAVIDDLVASGVTRVRVRRTGADWLGVTYPGDLEDARRHVAALVASGVYRSPLGGD
jgi:hypothetical protein